MYSFNDLIYEVMRNKITSYYSFILYFLWDILTIAIHYTLHAILCTFYSYNASSFARDVATNNNYSCHG